MPDLAVNVNRNALPFESLPAWRGLLREFEAGDAPHCRAVSAPLAWHEALVDQLARLTLGLGPDAPSPVETGHPDLLVAGGTEAGLNVDKAPDIAACRALGQDLALRPVASVRRLGVILAADRLLLPAANSLLKLAEEPPSHACILFLLEGADLLPTLRSRARFTVLSAPLEAEASPPPSDDGGWLAWLEEARLGDALAVAGRLAAWSAWALSEGKPWAAARMERLRLIAETRNLSVPMLCDLLILALREELPFEHLFDDIR